MQTNTNTIMIVDDSQFMRNVIKLTLQQLGYDSFVEAANGEQAIALYKTVHPNAVFLDITLPDINGLECLKEIVSMDQSPNVIICSAMGQTFYISEAYSMGAKDYVVKPFSPDRICAALRKCGLQ